jgi:hypothetical protein
MLMSLLSWLLMNAAVVAAAAYLLATRTPWLTPTAFDPFSLAIASFFAFLWLIHTILVIRTAILSRTVRSLPSKVSTSDTVINHRCRGVIGELLTSLQMKAQAARGSYLDYSAVMASFSERLRRRGALVVAGSTMLITLGLIGTVVGLIRAMAGLEGVTQSLSDPSADLVAPMSEALGGMSTAFYTTLVGALLGGILLRLLLVFSDSMMEHCIHRLSIFVDTELQPRLEFIPDKVVTEIYDQARTLLQEVRDHAAHVTRTCNEQVSQTAEHMSTTNEAIVSSLRMISESISRYEKAGEQVLKASHDIDDTVASQHSLLNQQVEVLQSLSDSLRKDAEQFTTTFITRTNDLFKRLESRAVVSAIRDLTEALQGQDGRSD